MLVVIFSFREVVCWTSSAAGVPGESATQPFTIEISKFFVVPFRRYLVETLEAVLSYVCWRVLQDSKA